MSTPGSDRFLHVRFSWAPLGVQTEGLQEEGIFIKRWYGGGLMIGANR